MKVCKLYVDLYTHIHKNISLETFTDKVAVFQKRGNSSLNSGIKLKVAFLFKQATK
jgi:hypothetical protein